MCVILNPTLGYSVEFVHPANMGIAIIHIYNNLQTVTSNLRFSNSPILLDRSAMVDVLTYVCLHYTKMHKFH